jgi:DNA primase
MLADKYVLSKYHSKTSKVEEESDRLIELVPRVMFEYKNKLLLETIKDKMLELKKANEQNDIPLLEKLMQEIGTLNIIKSQLAKTLGERIILKL